MYSVEEVRALVEGYEELRPVRHKLWILVRLADLDTALWHMPPKEYQAVLLCGLLGMSYRAAGDALGVSHETMYTRTERGLVWLTAYLNGSHRH